MFWKFGAALTKIQKIGILFDDAVQEVTINRDLEVVQILASEVTHRLFENFDTELKVD